MVLAPVLIFQSCPRAVIVFRRLRPYVHPFERYLPKLQTANLFRKTPIELGWLDDTREELSLAQPDDTLAELSWGQLARW